MLLNYFYLYLDNFRGSVIDRRKLKIMAGNNMWNAIVDVQRIGVRKIVHHDLKRNLDNDIALIHVSFFAIHISNIPEKFPTQYSYMFARIFAYFTI